MDTFDDHSKYSENEKHSAKIFNSRLSIHLIGIGCAGSNLIREISLKEIEGEVRLSVIDTDLNNLKNLQTDRNIQIGLSQTRGLGTGGDVDLGRVSAQSEKDRITKLIQGDDLVFVFTGLGGGTGSGVAPIVTKIASDLGALVINFVAMPFSFQGRNRSEIAENSLLELRQLADAVIPLPNDILIQQGREDVNVIDAFKEGNQWIEEAIYSICALLLKTGLINVEFPHLRKVFAHKGGRTLFAIGRGQGENGVQDALNNLIQCPLLHISEQSRAADHLLVNIQGGRGLKMPSINHIMKTVTDRFCSMDDTIFGATVNESFEDEVHILVLGTTDLDSGKAVASVTSLESKRFEDEPFENEHLTKPVHDSKKKESEEETRQGEFQFDFDDTGYFHQAEKNYYKDQDLDIPTYHRRNIQIVI